VGARGSLDTGGATAASPLANRAMDPRGCYRGWVYRLSTAGTGSAVATATFHVLCLFLILVHFFKVSNQTHRVLKVRQTSVLLLVFHASFLGLF
jgi:hypothetical protein